MNIGLVTPYFPDSQTINSGLANHFAILAEALEDLENDVVVIHIRPQYDHEQDVFDEQKINKRTILLTYKVKLPSWLARSLKNKWTYIDFLLKIQCMLLAASKLQQVQKKYRLEVIETTSYFSLCYLYLFTNPKPVVVTRVSTIFLQMMDNHYPFKSRLYRWIGRIELKMISKSRNLVTHASSHAQELEDQYYIAAKKFHIIPHGIRLPAKSEISAEKNMPFKILYVGRFEYRKGTDVLLNAIPLVLKNHPDVLFELIGFDTDNRCEQDFRTKNSSEATAIVIFRGGVDDTQLKKAYAACDIFVAPSRYESFGLIYIEAMSFGRPVIGCKVGGVQDIIEDGVNGLFAETGNAESLAEKIIQLISTTEIKSMGGNARKTVEEKFSKETLAVNSLSYYRSCIFNSTRA